MPKRPVNAPVRDAYNPDVGSIESDVEARLTRLVEKAGGLCLKWVSPGRLGVPDRIIIMPGGRILLVELKRPGGKPRASQKAFHAKLAARGVPVHIVDDADEFMRELASEPLQECRTCKLGNGHVRPVRRT